MSHLLVAVKYWECQSRCYGFEKNSLPIKCLDGKKFKGLEKKDSPVINRFQKSGSSGF